MMDLSWSIDWPHYIKSLIGFFAIVNPFSTIPVFAGLTIGYSAAEKKKTILTTSIAAFVILVISYAFGAVVLEFFGISIASFRIAGGILILMTALSMLQAKQSDIRQTKEEADEALEREHIAVVPLAMPLMAGPGSISIAIMASGNSKTIVDYLSGVIGILVVCLSIFLILKAGTKISERLGIVGMNIMTRIMGLLLAAIAIEFIVAGLAQKFPGLLT